jgi:hypothetical protein
MALGINAPLPEVDELIFPTPHGHHHDGISKNEEDKNEDNSPLRALLSAAVTGAVRRQCQNFSPHFSVVVVVNCGVVGGGC